jgi:hypothetical protein
MRTAMPALTRLSGQVNGFRQWILSHEASQSSDSAALAKGFIVSFLYLPANLKAGPIGDSTVLAILRSIFG